MGYTVICPHLNTQFFGGELPDSVWLDGDIVILQRCDIIVMAGEWTKSVGACHELEEAKRCKLEIIMDDYFFGQE